MTSPCCAFVYVPLHYRLKVITQETVFARLRLGKHAPAATSTHAIIELLDIVYSVFYVVSVV